MSLLVSGANQESCQHVDRLLVDRPIVDEELQRGAGMQPHPLGGRSRAHNDI
jgi:hypothetical protein